jgi:arylsulfatase
LLLLPLAFAVCPLSFAASGGVRPNIILIMADDMGFSCISPYGGEIRTPNLQRLADEGLRFTQFYNNAKCTTTRASLLSGMYPRNQGNSIPLDMPTLGEAMRAAGYRTALSGKWHLGSKPPQRPVDRGFDEYYGLMDGCCNFFNPARRDPDFKGGRVRAFGHNDRIITEFPTNYYSTDAFTDHAIATIRRFTAESKPFFLHLAFTCPHYPLHAPPEDIARYRSRYTLGWDVMREQRYARQKALGLWDRMPTLSGPDSKAYAWAEANQDWEDLRMATYAAMVDRMDQNIGRLMNAVKDLGIDDNTVSMFLSDNGGCTEEPGGRDDTQQPGIASTYTAVGPSWGWAQNTPFRRYKSWVNEGGISTPFIVRWPGGKVGRAVPSAPAGGAQTRGLATPGAITHQVGHIMDVLPTCLELAGGSLPAQFNGKPTPPLEGRSLVPVLHGRTREPHPELCWEWSGNCAIRRGNWKLVWDTLNKSRQWQLYDLATDRTELNDLAGQKPELVGELKAAYERWARATGRRIPGGGSTPGAGKSKKSPGA